MGQRVILKDPAHVVEQAGDRQHDGGWAEIVSLLQEELSILISLGGGTTKPRYCLGLVLWKPLPGQVQLTQHVLGVLVVGLRRFCEPIHRFGSILWHKFAAEILFPQPVGSPLVSVLRRFLQSAEALLRVTHLPVIGEK